MALLTPASISELLERHDLRLSRALGQNFLADPNTARRIVRLAEVDAGDQVLEIGPGIGSLTVALLDTGAEVTALELDRHVIPALEETVAGFKASLPEWEEWLPHGAKDPRTAERVRRHRAKRATNT